MNGVCGYAAREKVRVAHALEKLPLIHASFSKGEISYSKVRAISRVATPANQGSLLMIAKRGTAAHVETVVRGYRRAKADLELEEANTRHRRRELSWYFDDDDMVVAQPATCTVITYNTGPMAARHRSIISCNCARITIVWCMKAVLTYRFSARSRARRPCHHFLPPRRQPNR